MLISWKGTSVFLATDPQLHLCLFANTKHHYVTYFISFTECHFSFILSDEIVYWMLLLFSHFSQIWSLPPSRNWKADLSYKLK